MRDSLFMATVPVCHIPFYYRFPDIFCCLTTSASYGRMSRGEMVSLLLGRYRSGSVSSYLGHQDRRHGPESCTTSANAEATKGTLCHLPVHGIAAVLTQDL